MHRPYCLFTYQIPKPLCEEPEFWFSEKKVCL